MVGFIVICLAALASVGVQALSVERFQAPPAKCCLPKQYSSNMITLDSINADALFLLYMQMDYDRQQQAVVNYTMHSGGSMTANMRIVIDYGNETMYAMPSAHPETCYKIPLSLPLVQCIPDDAEYLGTDYMGPRGGGELNYDGWRMKFHNSKLRVTYTLAVTREGCVPVVEGAAYPDNPAQNALYFFSGFQPRLVDPSMFELPKSCFK